MIPTFACLYRTGGDYKEEHVEALQKQVAKHATTEHKFVCYTDAEFNIPGVICRKLEKNYPGWWSVAELFRNIGPTVVTGLDTIIWNNIDDLFHLCLDSSESDFWMMHGFRNRKETISGIMMWNGDWSWLWKEYKYPEVKRRFNGDQDYTTAKLKERKISPRIVQHEFKGVYSWKRHCGNGIPKDCSVLVFHGKPRPFDLPNLWNYVNA